jgi:hypothetical protein
MLILLLALVQRESANTKNQIIINNESPSKLKIS